MDSVTQSYSVLLVSASAKFMDSVLPLLPERSFSPITKARTFQAPGDVFWSAAMIF